MAIAANSRVAACSVHKRQSEVTLALDIFRVQKRRMLHERHTSRRDEAAFLPLVALESRGTPKALRPQCSSPDKRKMPAGTPT